MYPLVFDSLPSTKFSFPVTSSVNAVILFRARKDEVLSVVLVFSESY